MKERSPPRRFSPRRDPTRRDDRQRSPVALPSRRGRSRSPVPGSRRYSPRSQRLRSPAGMKRGRDQSPVDYEMPLSPLPPAKKESLASPPRGRYDQGHEPGRRPSSPPRDRDRRHSPAGTTRTQWRQPSPPSAWRGGPVWPQGPNQHRYRSPSPARHEGHTGRRSGMSSRRVSRSPPPIDRTFHVGGSGTRSRHSPRRDDGENGGAETLRALPHRAALSVASRSPPPLDSYDDHAPVDTNGPRRWHDEHERSPDARQYAPPPHSTDGKGEHRSPPRRRLQSPLRENELEYHHDGDSGQFADPLDSPYRDGRPAGSGREHVAGGHGGSVGSVGGLSPRHGHSNVPVSMSAHNRPGSNSVLSAPSQPRGGSGPPPRRDYGYGGQPPYRRGGPYHQQNNYSYSDRYHSQPSPYGRGPYGPPPRERSPSAGVPTGPRSGYGYRDGGGSSNGGSNGAYHHGHYDGYGPPRRDQGPAHRIPPSAHNSTSRTYPLTQRFRHHLSDMPSVVPGGKAAPPGTDKNVAERLARLENERRRLEDELAERLEKKRSGIRTWDRLERENSRDGLKSDLAEQQVGALSGENGMGGSSF